LRDFKQFVVAVLVFDISKFQLIGIVALLKNKNHRSILLVLKQFFNGLGFRRSKSGICNFRRAYT